jgi:xanthine dehydrogenase accessory factor
MTQAIPFLELIPQVVGAGRRVALCVVVARRGSAPQVPGAMMTVDEAGQVAGTVGGGVVEAVVQRRALELIASSGSGVYTFDLEDACGQGEAAICGGEMDVAIMAVWHEKQVEPIRKALGRLHEGHMGTLPIQVSTAEGPVEYHLNLESMPKLVIAGGGHVGLALARAAVPLGFKVSVVDDRLEFANAERFPPPIEPVAGDMAETLRGWPIDANTYVAIVTRGHMYDEHALAAVLNSPAKYVGMIGSRRKIDIVFGKLRQKGATQEQLQRVHAPIGLPIRGVTPEEIAISIAAELISVRRADHRSTVEGPFPVTDVEP